MQDSVEMEEPIENSGQISPRVSQIEAEIKIERKRKCENLKPKTKNRQSKYEN